MPIIRQTTNIKVIPAGVTPTYNETIVVLESPNIISDNFKWIVKIYKGESTDPDYELLSTINILPNPDGYGVIDFHRHIENHISTSFYPADIDRISGDVVNEGLKWSFELIEQFENPRWRYYDYYTPTGSKVGFTTDTGIYSAATDIPHPFIVGDRITVVQDPGFTHPTYNFVDVEIDDVPSAYSIVLDETYIPGGGPQDPGLITLVGGGSREIEQIFDAGETTIYSFNGALSFQGFRNWDYTDYRMNSTSPPTTKFLLNGPREFDVTLNDRVWINSFIGNPEWEGLIIETNNGTYAASQTFSESGQHFINQNKIGPIDWLETTDPSLSAMVGSLPVVDDTTTYIEITPYYVYPGTPVGETIRLNIVDDCSKYEAIRFFYLDKFGSYLPLTFNKVSKQNNTNTRQNYRQNYGRYDSVADAWGYTTYDRGTTTYDLNTTEKVTCTSDWINEDMRDMVIDMLNSPSVYIQDDNGEYIAITITTNSYEIKKKVNVKLINYTLSFEYSQMNTNQRG